MRDVNNVRSYFYQNYIFSFINNNLVGARKYSENLTDANVAFICRNYASQKITSHTFDTPPDELVKAIEIIANETGYKQNSWKIEEANITFSK